MPEVLAHRFSILGSIRLLQQSLQRLWTQRLRPAVRDLRLRLEPRRGGLTDSLLLVHAMWRSQTPDYLHRGGSGNSIGIRLLPQRPVVLRSACRRRAPTCSWLRTIMLALIPRIPVLIGLLTPVQAVRAASFPLMWSEASNIRSLSTR